MNTYEGLNREMIPPPFHNVPTGYQTIHNAVFGVKQKEWIYRNGNDRENLEFEDCFSWQKLAAASGCAKICLPVTFQYAYEEKIDRPRCNTTIDHNCMMASLINVRPIL